MQFAILLFVLIQCAFGAILPQVDNPCTQEQLYSLKYYQPYQLSERKYIECTPWNGMEVRECYANAKWSTWWYRCSDEALERTLNATVMPIAPVVGVDMPVKPVVGSIAPDVVIPVVLSNVTSCAYYGLNETCLNGGICNMYPGGGRCACPSNTTGEYCQYKNETTLLSAGVFGQLINESFSLDTYRLNRQLLDEFYMANGTIDATLVESNQTRARIAEYLALYPNGTMRFDMLVSYLIQDFLSVIYPSQFFLREFAFPSEVAMGYINAIPSLLLSSKYAYDSFDNFWAVYEDLLSQLVKYLSKQVPTIRHEAELFFQIYDGFFRQFGINSQNLTSVPSEFASSLNASEQVTVEMIKSKIRRDFNETLDLSWTLFRALGRFDEEIGQRVTLEKINATFVQELVANFSMCDNVTALIGQLGESNAEIWDSSVFYGFWYVVSEFVSAELIDDARNQSFLSTQDVKLQRLIRPTRPKGVFSTATHQSRIEQEQGAPIFQALVADREQVKDLVPEKLTAENVTSLKIVDDKKAEKLVAELPVVVNASTLKIVGDKKAEKLSSENVTFVPLPSTEKLVADVPVVVNASSWKIVGEKINITEQLPVNMSAIKLVADVPAVNVSAIKLVSDLPVFNASAIKLVADVPTVNVSAIKLVSDLPVVNVSAIKLVADEPQVEKLVAPAVNVSAIKLVADVPVVNVSAIKLVSDLPVVNVSAIKLVADEPQVEKLVAPVMLSENRTVVVSDKKIVRPLAIVADEEVFPRKLVSAFLPVEKPVAVVDELKPKV